MQLDFCQRDHPSLWAVYDSKQTHFPQGINYLRFKESKGLIFVRIGPDRDEARARLAQKSNLFEGQPQPI